MLFCGVTKHLKTTVYFWLFIENLNKIWIGATRVEGLWRWVGLYTGLLTEADWASSGSGNRGGKKVRQPRKRENRFDWDSLVILSMANCNGFHRIALLFKTLILIGMKLWKNLLDLSLGKIYCVLWHNSSHLRCHCHI